jgi:hypothetical protein
MNTVAPNCSKWYAPSDDGVSRALQYGVGVPEGYPAFTPEEAEAAAKKLGS